jgi:esterase/lipase
MNYKNLNNLIHNQITDKLTLLKQEYNNKLDRNVKEVNVKIRSVVKEGFAQIEKYLSANSVTKQDLETLQKFQGELVEVNQITADIGLDKLNAIINKITLNGVDKAYFQSKSTLKDKVGLLLGRFNNFFVGRIRNKINKLIFFTWNQKLRFNKSLNKIVKFNEQISKLEARLAENPENMNLKRQLDSKKAELVRNEKFVAEYEKNLATAERTRKQFEIIGGTHLALQTKDGETLDGIYLNVENFRKKCAEAGAKQVKISVPVDGINAEIPGLILLKDEDADKFIKTLEQLKLFKDFNEDLLARNKGGGWTKVNIGDQVSIVPDFEVECLLKKGIITEKVEKQDVNSRVKEVSYSFAENVFKDVKLDSKDLKIDAKKSGTIIMGMGAAGIYEMAKREAVSLLMQGINVMLYNHRGQGASSGKPSEKGIYEDMETVYQYLKQAHNASDENLVLRGLCLSGGFVSELASRHPKVNIILDQTYADISDISLNTVLDSVKDVLNYNPENAGAIKKAIIAVLTPILRAVTSLVSPDFRTAAYLKDVQGKILILRATEDTYTSKEMTDKILNTYASHSSPERSRKVWVGHMPGIHGSPWLDARKAYGNGQKVDLGRYHIISFLKETGTLNPFIDKGSTLKELSSDYTSYLQSHVQSFEAFEKTMQALSEKLEDVPKEIAQLPLQAVEEVKKAQTIESLQLPGVVDGRHNFDAALKELTRCASFPNGKPHM